MTEDETQFADALAQAIVADLQRDPLKGPLVRFVLRWFEEDDPLYFTLHFLGEGEANAVPKRDAWYPLEWPNLDRELGRSDRISQERAVRKAGETLAAGYAASPHEDSDEWQASPAIVDTVAAVVRTLEASEVPLAPTFVATATHFEAFGGINVLRRMGRDDWVRDLEARRELPQD